MRRLVVNLFCLTVCLGIFSCSDNDENKDGYADLSCNVKAVKGNPESIVGKWKLMKS